ncbi:MAG: CAP domain-containing protein [Peptococcia bacterium]
MRSSGNVFWQMIRQFFIVPIVAISLASVFLIPAQAQEQIITHTYVKAASDADVLSIRPMAQNADIYELLLHDQVVLRYRSMHQGLSARERAEIILQRAVEFGQAMQNGQLAVTTINGSNVITINSRLFITVTEADFKANNSTGEGLANVWLLNIQAARENKVPLGAPSVDDDSLNNDSENNDSENNDSENNDSENNRRSTGRARRTDKNKDGQAGPKEDPAPVEEPAEDDGDDDATGNSGGSGTPAVEENQGAAEEETGKTEEELAANCSTEEAEMLQLINQERAKAGVAPLTMDSRLVKAARMKSADMIAKNYFDHTSPTYGDTFAMMTNLGIAYGYAGENLAGNPTLEGAHESLMGSPGHRKNILNPHYTHAGIGIIEGGPYGKMYTQLFISKP